MKNIFEIWFVTGSQHLYGKKTLQQVTDNLTIISNFLDSTPSIPVNIVYKPTVKTPDEITQLCIDANTKANCIGLICWMHTFSPAKMWIQGLQILNKPFMHLHTQFNRDIPYDNIDMDFMNLNQSAHSGREFGFIVSRMRISRKVVVGHWKNKNVHQKIENWTRAAIGVHSLKNCKVARFGDNMRQVAVTEGDKVSAQIALGMSVNGYGIGDLVKSIEKVTDSDVSKLLNEIDTNYLIDDSLKENGKSRESLIESVKIEQGIRNFLKEGEFHAFTTTFEDLHGLSQLPGFAVQRLMKEGYGFAAEGDWKTAPMLYAFKQMAIGLDKGTSFMEDYTYHLEPNNMKVLGSHMLEICESIADGKPSVETHPLGIGGKAYPVRSKFTADSGDAINVALMDMEINLDY